MEPSRKRLKANDQDMEEMVCDMQQVFFNKLKSIEEKIEKISSRYLTLQEKVNFILSNVLGIQDVIPSTSISSDLDTSSTSVQVLTNTISDYPYGSWLGDPDSPDLRVRCAIKPKDLQLINKTCTSPEKMSLTLLDYLFDREIQACSNLSGAGKHGKKKLDPHKVFGIKCHVMYMFGITEDDWNRIKLNIDSKCRTAFRRKLKGMPLNVRGAKGRALYTLKTNDDKSDPDNSSLHKNDSSDSQREITTMEQQEHLEEIAENETDQLKSSDLIHQIPPAKTDSSLSITFPEDFKPEIIHTESGRIQVIRATKEQFEQLKQNHQLQVLSRSQILPV